MRLENGHRFSRLSFTSISKTIATSFLIKMLVFLVKKCVKFVMDEQHTEGHYQLLVLSLLLKVGYKVIRTPIGFTSFDGRGTFHHLSRNS